MERKCEHCGAAFNIPASVAALRGKGRFCSRECVRAARADRVKPRPLAIRFWDRVERPEGDGCWLWLGAKNRRGYGSLCIKKPKREEAHRVAYRLTFGEIPGDQVVRHKCDNPSCVRPDHLELGTQGDNIRDAVDRGRIAVGIRHGSAVLDAATVQAIREDHAAGATIYGLAKRHNVGQQTVSDIVHRKTWRHL